MLTFCLLLWAGCGGGPALAPTTTAPLSIAAARAKIQHVVIIFQENRTTDNLFHGLPGADTANYGINSRGQMVPLRPVNMAVPYDLDHSHNGVMFGGGFLTAYDNGAMNGFDGVRCRGNCEGATSYAYVRPDEVQPYFQMAEEYTFADRMFQTNAGPSWPAHQYIISGTSSIDGGPLYVAENPGYANLTALNCTNPQAGNGVYLIDIRTGVETINHPACVDHPTLLDELEAKHLTYKYYVNQIGGLWNGPSAVRHIRFGPSWPHVSMPNVNIFRDISSGRLPNVSWVMPGGPQSDHASITDGSGPSWVASVVNAIGDSRYWKNTAIFVTWDDWGGWYDHVRPPRYNAYELGFRVPLIVISPYAKRSYVSHVQHEFGSILHFTEDVFDLPSLGYTDTRGDDLSDCFDFHQRPTTFHTIAAPRNAVYFMKLPPSNVPVDDDF
ncbi:MAG TPA: alkaline phosphatase family protein [Candidatus Baltobacteraceae bacterium]|nr:alkaline phosphatase family protein [Candidatus Baltobacteraceae bacterium]